jgi:hypothetical protein
MNERPRPLPLLDADNAPFWEAAARHELCAQRCPDCGRWRWPPRPMCPYCGSLAVVWQPLTGRGTIYSYTIITHPTHPFWTRRVPYLVVLVELEEGIRLIGNLLDWQDGQPVEIGTPVTVTWETVDDITLPQFQRSPA